jgi:hypothetical protein
MAGIEHVYEGLAGSDVGDSHSCTPFAGFRGRGFGLEACLRDPDPWWFVADAKIVLFRTARPTGGDKFASFMGSVVLNCVRRAVLAHGAAPAEQRMP